MFTKVYWIYVFDNTAKLGIMARPRGGDWLYDEIANLKKQNVQLLVSLLEKEEIVELGLLQEEAACKNFGIEFINFSISDRGIPASGSNIDLLICNLKDKLQKGISVVIHCRMGIGRSSIIAGSVLLQEGLSADKIISDICKIRGLKVPDTDEQLRWLKARQ